MSDYRTPTSGGATTDVARQEGQQVKDTARDAASNVADTAATRGQEMRGQARQHARSIAGDAQRQLRGHAQQETQRAGDALGTAGDQLRALAEGRVDEAGALGGYVEAAADAISSWADSIQDRGFEGLLDDLRSFGRRRPGMFLAGALAAGIVAGRFGRNAARELGDDDTSAPGGTARTSPGSSGAGAGVDRAAGDEDVAWRATDRLVDPGDPDEPVGGGVAGGGHTPRDGSDSDDDMIVGYASDDSAVVVGPTGTTAGETADERPVAPPRDTDDVAYRPVDVDEERAR